jgi:hypothetical protein
VKSHVQLLLLHNQLALLDLKDGCLFKLKCQTEDAACANEPLSRVVIEPPDAVAPVIGKFVVKVMIAFSEGDEGSEEVVPWSTDVIKGVAARHVRKAIDTERRVVYNDLSKHSRIDETAPIVAPEVAGHHGWSDERCEDRERQVQLVLDLRDNRLR